MEAAGSFETMVHTYHTTRHHTLVVYSLHTHYCKNFRSHTGRNLEVWKSLTRVYDKCTFALYLRTRHECEDKVPHNWRSLPTTMLRTLILRETRMLWETKISQTRLLTIYRGDDKSLARPGRKQANVSVRRAWISLGALPCRKKKELDDSSRLDVVEIARVPDMFPSLFPSWSGSGLISTPVYLFSKLSVLTYFKYEVYQEERKKHAAIAAAIISTTTTTIITITTTSSSYHRYYHRFLYVTTLVYC